MAYKMAAKPAENVVGGGGTCTLVTRCPRVPYILSTLWGGGGLWRMVATPAEHVVEELLQQNEA
jgi:hypothetical protein